MIKVLGFAALMLTDIAYIPQIIITFKTRKCELSWLTLIMLSLGMTLWTIYASLNGDVPLIVSSAVSLLQLIILLPFKIYQNATPRKSNTGISTIFSGL